MHPLRYYCDESAVTTFLIENFGEHLETFEQKEKYDLLYNITEVLWNRHQPAELFDERVMTALMTVQGQADKDLIKLCKALIDYLEADMLKNSSSSVVVGQLPQTRE